MSVKIKIKDIDYTLEEAQEIYEHLDNLFGKKTHKFTLSVPQVIPGSPQRPDDVWYKTTSNHASEWGLE